MSCLRKKNIAILGLVGMISATLFTGCKVSSDTPIIGKILGLHSDEIFEVDDLICSDNEYKLVFMNYVNKYKRDLGDTSLRDFLMDKVKEDITVTYTLSAMAETERVKLDKDDMKIINSATEEYYESLSDEEKEYIGSDFDVVAAVYSNYYLADKVL